MIKHIVVFLCLWPILLGWRAVVTDGGADEWVDSSLTHTAGPLTITSKSPDGITHRVTARTTYKTDSGSGLLLKITTADESIFRSADLTIRSNALEDIKDIRADMTYLNIVGRLDKDTIEVGKGSVVQLALIQNQYLDISGAPGTFVMLQPGTSVVWNGMDLSCEGDEPAGFRIGFKDGGFVMTEVVGKLHFKRIGKGGHLEKGDFVQDEKGRIREVF
jgi:hypothetical protein